MYSEYYGEVSLAHDAVSVLVQTVDTPLLKAPFAAFLDRPDRAEDMKVGVRDAAVLLVRLVVGLTDWIKAVKEELSKPQAPDLAALLTGYYEGRNAGAWSRNAKIGNLKNFAEAVNFLTEILLLKSRLFLFPRMGGDFTRRGTALIQLATAPAERARPFLCP